MATKMTEYGPPGTWTAEDLASLGGIPAGKLFLYYLTGKLDNL
jgi:hypothetical protein